MLSHQFLFFLQFFKIHAISPFFHVQLNYRTVLVSFNRYMYLYLKADYTLNEGVINHNVP